MTASDPKATFDNSPKIAIAEEQRHNKLRTLIWIAGATFASFSLYLPFRNNLIFTLIGFVAIARIVLVFVAEYREKKLYRELDDLNFEETKTLLENAGQQGLVKRPPPR